MIIVLLITKCHSIDSSAFYIIKIVLVSRSKGAKFSFYQKSKCQARDNTMGGNSGREIFVVFSRIVVLEDNSLLDLFAIVFNT